MPDQAAAVSTEARPAINDCWNKIGVQGDGSCPELVRHIHCHNCPVYANAARTFLDRDLPQNYLDEWTRHFAREKTALELNTLSVVLFRIGAEWFALPVTVFKEISELKTIHSLPHRRNNLVLGLVNFRGELLICVSLAEALGLGAAPESNREHRHAVHPYLLIISDGGNRLVFPVDEVGGIQHFNLKEVKKVPATVAGARSTYTTGLLNWRDKTVGYLDAGLLFHTLGRSLS
jgi:chemotaxis-related protein WspD